MPIERIDKGSGKKSIVGYHTQECRYDEEVMEEPVYDGSKKAWLGPGYYFWVDLIYAHYWGEDGDKCQCDSGLYSIYKAEIPENNMVNAVFDQKGYKFFRNAIHKAIDKLDDGSGTVQLYRLHQFLKDKFWSKKGISGIIFDDMPNTARKDRIYTKIKDLNFEKRIQMVVFHINNINNFELHLDEVEINSWH